MMLRPQHLQSKSFVPHEAGWEVVDGWRNGSLEAAQAFVRSRQAEATLIAYLLTGDADRARGLSTAAFLNILREAKTVDPEAEPRMVLLASIGRCFLHKEYESVSGPDVGAQERVAVENGRDRTLAALARLDASERLALILGEIAGLDEPGINQVLEGASESLTVPTGRAHRRLRHTLTLPDRDPVRALLLEASFDRPRDDLWPDVEGPLIEIRNRCKRCSRKIAVGLAGAVMLVALVSMGALFGDGLINGNSDAAVEVIAAPVVEDDLSFGQLVPVAPTSTPSPTPLPTGNVPDTLLAEIRHDADTEDAYTSLAVYNAERNELEAVTGDAMRVPGSNSNSTHISPDGGQIVMLRSDWLEEVVHYTAIAIDSSTLECQWQVELGAFENDPYTGVSVRMTVALTSERVYVAMMSQESPGVATIRVLDRNDGSLRESAEIEIDPVSVSTNFRGNVFLFVSPDETRLTVAIEAWDQTGYSAVDAFLYSIELPTLEVVGQVTETPLGEARQVYSLWNAPMTPAGDALYSLRGNDDRGLSEIAFFDLASGEISSIQLPFDSGERSTTPTLSTVTSNDGSRLYVIDRMSSDVATINLTARRVESFFPIDTGAFGSRFGVGTGQFVFGWGHLLSVEGTRLYIAASADHQTRMQEPIDSSGVWVIDLREWKIVDFWPVNGGVSEIFSELDDGSILIQSWHYDDPEERRFPYRLTRIGEAGGVAFEEQTETLMIEDQDDYFAVSLPGLYRSQHNQTPRIDGVESSDVEIRSTLPRIEATMPSSVASGVKTTVEVRARHPETGAVLDKSERGVRFDPDSAVTIFLRSEDHPGQIIVPATIDDGVYRAVTIVPTAGAWTIDVAVNEPDGTNTLTRNAGAFEAAPTFVGSDDRLYTFRVSADPEQPVVGEKTTVRLDLVDVEHGKPMPEDVELAARQPALDGSLSDGMPGRIDVALAGPGLVTGSRTALLYQVSPGIYEGTLTFADSGTWEATIRFQPPGGRRIEIPAGTIEVVEASN